MKILRCLQHHEDRMTSADNHFCCGKYAVASALCGLIRSLLILVLTGGIITSGSGFDIQFLGFNGALAGMVVCGKYFASMAGSLECKRENIAIQICNY